MAEEQQQTEEQQSQKSSNNLMPIIIALVVIILLELGFVAYIVFTVKSGGPDTKEDTKKEKVKEEEDSVSTISAYSDPIEVLVNVKGTNGDRFLKASLMIEYDPQKYPKMAEILTNNMPKFKDITIKILSSKNINVLLNEKSIEKIKGELIREFSKYIPKNEGKIKSILITEWLIQ